MQAFFINLGQVHQLIQLNPRLQFTIAVCRRVKCHSPPDPTCSPFYHNRNRSVNNSVRKFRLENIKLTFIGTASQSVMWKLIITKCNFWWTLAHWFCSPEGEMSEWRWTRSISCELLVTEMMMIMQSGQRYNSWCPLRICAMYSLSPNMSRIEEIRILSCASWDILEIKHNYCHHIMIPKGKWMIARGDNDSAEVCASAYKESATWP